MRSSTVNIGAILATVCLLSAAQPGRAQSVSPVRIDDQGSRLEVAAVAGGNPQRLDAAIYETPVLEAGSYDDQTVWVPRSVLDDLCADNDGCTMRLVWIDDEVSNSGPVSRRSWWFGIRQLGEWRAVPSSDSPPFFIGNISTLPHEGVALLPTAAGDCRLRDDNGTNELGFPYQRLEVIAEASAEPAEASFHCLLRIDD